MSGKKKTKLIRIATRSSFFSGILGEYVGSIYTNILKRPLEAVENDAVGTARLLEAVRQAAPPENCPSRTS